MIAGAMLPRLVEALSAGKVRHVTPVAPRAATGVVATVYAALREEFLVTPPLTLHSPVPALLAAFWGVLRETLVAGVVPRARKEAVATVVSRLNACPFCVDAHLMALQAAGQDASTVRAVEEGRAEGIDDPDLRALVRWTEVGLAPDDPRDVPPAPFPPSETAEILGTGLCFHYVNRLVNVFCETSPLPLPDSLGAFRGPLRRASAPFLAMRVGQVVPRGRGLAFTPEAALAADLAWARHDPTVARAVAGFTAVLEGEAAAVTSPATLACVRAYLERAGAGEPALGRVWLDDAVSSLDAEARPAARLALLVAVAPRRVDATAIDAFRAGGGGDGAVVALAAWASFTAARRILRRLA